VKRLGRIAWNGLALMSMLMCLAAAALWVRSDDGIGVARNSYTDHIDQSSQVEEYQSLGIGIISTDSELGIYFDRLRYKGPATGLRVRSEYEYFEWGTMAQDQFLLLAEKALRKFGFWLDWKLTRERQFLLLGVPFWFAVIVFGVAPAIRAHQWRKARKRRRGHLCSSCGYDLRATPEHCPECGTVPAKK